METTTTETLPDWLTIHPPGEDKVPRFPRTKDDRELQDLVFSSVFELVLDALEGGESASMVVRRDPRKIDLGRFMAWVRKDTERQKRFDAAEQNGTRIIEDALVDIAQGDPNSPPEDVQRSKLRIDTLWKVLQVRNRKRYGADAEKANQFSGGITVVIGSVESPYAKREPLTLEQS